MKKRSDRNSITAEVSQYRDSNMGLAEWPSTVPRPDGDVAADVDAIFNGIVATRPASAWSSFDVARAAQLAQIMYLIGRDTETLVRTGTLIRSERNKPIPNPVLYALEKTGHQASALARQLGLTIQTNKAGDPRDQMASNNQFEQKYGRALANGNASVVDAGPAELPSAIAHLIGNKNDV